MFDFTRIPHPLRNRRDLARFVGLSPRAPQKEIISAFTRATRCEAILHIEEEPVVTRGAETWEVRIIQDMPKCRLVLREGGRGAWLEAAEAVPEEVLAAFQARADRDGRIITKRSWKLWEKTRWTEGRGRRLRGRVGEIHLLVNIADVTRQTGEVRSRIVIEPLGGPCPDPAPPVRLDLPVLPVMITRALEVIRERATAPFNLAA